MLTSHRGLCLHERRGLAVGAFIFFAYFFARQIVHLVEPPHPIPTVHPFRISVAGILVGIVCAVGLFREVTCTAERMLLILVAIDCFSSLVAILVNSPPLITRCRIISAIARLVCAVIAGKLVFQRSPRPTP